MLSDMDAVNTVADDQESFIHAVMWVALKYGCHNLSESQTKRVVTHLYDEVDVYSDGRLSSSNGLTKSMLFSSTWIRDMALPWAFRYSESPFHDWICLVLAIGGNWYKQYHAETIAAAAPGTISRFHLPPWYSPAHFLPRHLLDGLHWIEEAFGTRFSYSNHRAIEGAFKKALSSKEWPITPTPSNYNSLKRSHDDMSEDVEDMSSTSNYKRRRIS